MKCQACGSPDVCRNVAGGLYRVPAEGDEMRGPFRYAVVCEGCLERLDADMWITESHWRELGPLVPFENLPTEEGEG